MEDDGEQKVPAQPERPQSPRYLPELELALWLASPARHPVIARYNDQRRQRAQHFTDEFRGVDVDSEALARLLQSEGATDLLMAAFTAAIETHTELKRKALAQAVRGGLLAADSASIDEARVLVRVIEQLEAVHLRVLLEIAKGADPRPAPVEGKPSVGHGGIGGASHETLAAVWPQQEPVLRALTAFLEAQGLISKDATWGGLEGGGTWFVTDFGRSLLALLGADESKDSSPSDV